MEANMSKAKERIPIWDNLKFILIFLVVLGHLADCFIRSYNMRVLYFYIYIFHMPLFIFISGLFSKRTIEEKNYKKIFEYLILYVAINFFYVLSSIFFHFVCGTKGVSLDLFSINSGGAPWFLFSIFSFYLITIAFNKLDKKYLLVLSVIVACFVGYDNRIGDFLALSRTIVYYPFFLAGYLLNAKDVVTFVKNRKIQILSFIFIISTCLICLFFMDKIYFLRPLLTGRNPYSVLAKYKSIGLLLRFVYYIVVSIFIISIISLTPSKNSIFTKLGSRSLCVYFFHIPIINFLSTTPVILKFLDNTSYLLIIPISFIITILLSQKCFEIVLNYIKEIRLENKKITS